MSRQLSSQINWVQSGLNNPDISNDTKWTNLKNELLNYQNHLKILQKQRQMQSNTNNVNNLNGSRPTKPPLRFGNKKKLNENENENNNNDIINNNIHKRMPTKPPMRLKQAPIINKNNNNNNNNNSYPLLRLFIKISPDQTQEIIIWENNDQHFNEQINKFCIDNRINQDITFDLKQIIEQQLSQN